MHRVVSALEQQAALSVLLVWINMLPSDERADLPDLLDELANPRIEWFHDRERVAGKAVAAALGAPGETAWDMYMGFDAGARWGDAMPRPRGWLHQLTDAWADPTLRHVRDELEPALSRLVEDLLSA